MRTKITILLLLLITLLGTSAFAQQVQISGNVISDEDGLSLPGVSVIVVGTTTGTATDFDGNYTISAEKGQQLSFSFIGLKDEVVTVNNQSTINMVMISDANTLSEVIVTGFTKETRATVAGSIATIQTSEIAQVPIASFDQALQGRAAGLQVSSGSGQPGTASSVRIRGVSSISGGSTPLYILDGVQISAGDFAALNSNDFETFSVLKDASATAIYGSRGTNGVIVITTKRGKAGKTKVNYRFNFGYSKRNEMKVGVMDSPQKLSFEEYAGRGQGWNLSPNNPDNAGLSPEELEANRLELQRLSGINTNWTDVFTRDGMTQQHELNASGGSERTNYYMSVSYFNQEGIALASDLKRITGRLNFSHKIYDNLRVDVNLSIGDAVVNDLPGEGAINLRNPFATAYLANPYEKLYNEDGSYAFSSTYGPQNYENLIENTRQYRDLKHVGSVSLIWNITSDLIFKSIYGIDNSNTIREYGTKPSTFFGQEDDFKNGSQSQIYGNGLSQTMNNILLYNKQLNDDHTFGIMLGQEWVNSRYESFGYSGYGINEKLYGSTRAISPGSIKNDALHNTPDVFRGSKWEQALLSYFADGKYTYKGKYTIRGNVRMDGSSKFTKENRWALLWSTAAIWNIKQEAFLENVDWLSNFRVRASYGKTGNQGPISRIQKDFTWTTNSYGGEQGLSTVTMDNKDLQWEVAHKSNLGFDFGLFDSRLRGSIELYNENVSKNFISYQLSRTTGFASMNYNAGEMRNRGIEIDIKYDLINANGLLWSVFGNYAYNENEITDLGQVKEFEQGTSIIRTGLALGSHYIVGWAGVDPTTGRPLYFDKEGGVTSVYSAENNVANFGTYIPPTIGGFGSNLSWKGFDLNMLFSFQSGFKRFNNQRFFQENHNFAQYNMSVVMEDIWKQPGDITEIQSKDYNLEFSSKFIEDASFMRLRDISLGYGLPSSLVQKMHLERLRVYGRVQNLLTWTSWQGFDPEDDNNIASYEYPTPTIFTIGLDVNF